MHGLHCTPACIRKPPPVTGKIHRRPRVEWRYTNRNGDFPRWNDHARSGEPRPDRDGHLHDRGVERRQSLDHGRLQWQRRLCREYVAGGRYGLYFREHGSRVGTVGPPPSRQPCKKVYELVGWFKANRV